MTLAEYNARRRALTRLERVGWLNYRINTLNNIACYLFHEADAFYAEAALVIANRTRQYRAKHKFWECL